MTTGDNRFIFGGYFLFVATEIDKMLHYRTGWYNRKPEVEALPIRVAGVIRESIVDGPDLRYVVFVQGCPHHCKGCHNPETHDPDAGILTSTKIIWDEITSNPMLHGVTFSGGEPFMWAKELAVLGKAARDSGLNVFTYTGYVYEKLVEMAKTDSGIRDLLCVTNYLVDGPFVLEKRDLSLLFRGSSNQRILDINNYPNSTEIHTIEKF